MTNSTLRLLGALSLCLLLAASPALAGAQQSGTSSRPVSTWRRPRQAFGLSFGGASRASGIRDSQIMGAASIRTGAACRGADLGPFA
jgi:hypothetical protein